MRYVTLLFITQQYNAFFGGGMITERNLQVCRNALGEQNVSTFFLPERKGGIHTFIEYASCYLMGLNKKKVKDVLDLLSSSPEIKYVFIDYSLLGRLAKAIKKKFPQVHVLVFFHNVEIVYYSAYIKTSKRYLHSIGFPATIINEKNAIKYADSVLTLNKRDSDLLVKKYGRSADLILPTSMADHFDMKNIRPVVQGRLSLLFVGSLFFPNEQAMRWMIVEVMPHVKNASLKIVGKGFEKFKQEWNSENVEVIGAVADLAPYYYDADVVVSPIFTGSGMKTKTAEALMYGKTIAASTEAFEGYDIDRTAVGGEFNMAEEYIAFINNFKHDGPYKFNERSRNYFTSLYSLSAANELFRGLIDRIGH